MTKPSTAQQAIDDLYQRHRERGATIFIVPCDGGCGAAFEGTTRERKKAGWVTRWRVKPGEHVESQVDLCPTCKTGAGRRPAPGAGAR